jgi:hypothetical protein
VGNSLPISHCTESVRLFLGYEVKTEGKEVFFWIQVKKICFNVFISLTHQHWLKASDETAVCVCVVGEDKATRTVTPS